LQVIYDIHLYIYDMCMYNMYIYIYM
jgi:hypothetical protein